jgi:hypothetical protein
MQPITIKLTYESLIALLQGKELNVVTMDQRFVFIPPFDGVWMTHEQLDQIRYQDQKAIFDLLDKIRTYTQEEKPLKKS